jgi:hypothetical protein
MNRRQAPARSAVSRLVAKRELTRSVCDNEKGMPRRHTSARTQDNAACAREELL